MAVVRATGDPADGIGDPVGRADPGALGAAATEAADPDQERESDRRDRRRATGRHCDTTDGQIVRQAPTSMVNVVDVLPVRPSSLGVLKTARTWRSAVGVSVFV